MHLFIYFFSKTKVNSAIAPDILILTLLVTAFESEQYIFISLTLFQFW